jgi:hypothetical protein
MSFLPKKNLKYNREIPLSDGLINGQALGAVSGMKFGLSNMSRSGCEVIAVYNALLLHNRPADFLKIAHYMERFRMALGFWGTNFLALGHCLRRFGLRSSRTRRPAAAEAALKEGRYVMFVYWCGKRFRSSVHTVILHAEGETLCVYNAFNQCGKIFRASFEDYLVKRRMICAYIIRND